MAEKLIISISGMRGILGENLTPEIATEYGRAFGTFLKKELNKTKLTVCIGRDSRPSGPVLSTAITEGLCSVGVDVVELGIVTTPTVGVMLRHLNCDGGIVITASHNPVQYNGVKLLLNNGIAPGPTDAEKIRQYYFDKDFDLADETGRGKVTTDENADDVHIAKVLATIDEEVIIPKHFHVVLDSVNGAGGRPGMKLLKLLGCEARAVNYEPTGNFAHTPEPTAANLRDFCEEVKKAKADVGFAQDPDADRLAIIDENGEYIGEEYTLALASKYIFSKQSGSAAANLSTSRMIDDIAEQYGAKVYRTAVGEANVAAAMVKNDCVIGGEGNGGVIDLRVGPIRDSLVSMALVLALMAEAGKTVSELVEDIDGYYMFKDKFSADDEQAQQIIESAKDLFADAKIDTTDGCRFDFADGWVHLRTSNTEPVMRMIVEAKDQKSAEKHIDAVKNIRKKILG